ncbi:MAG TPA: hypothetical protein VED66_09640 [Candidatus Sulfotelmatobacter sp.]|nr:hypothetical protein [Candidatus Sulfotelmatobacter sp.]
MADWKQITARIRRARSGKDPAGQLTNLFSKTRDAMVAFELARYFESKGNTADAGRWYLTAAERFRRADWKTKAQESATRLGATEPAEIPAPSLLSATVEEPVAEAAPQTGFAEAEAARLPVEELEVVTAQPEAPVRAPTEPSRQRRGRRGGRDQRHPRRGSHPPAPRERHAEHTPARSIQEAAPERPAPIRPTESAAEIQTPAGIRGRFGDPGLASRLTQLEMNFRRLLACAPSPLGEADKAPAGPGVWVLTDSDLSTYYYVESCQTLRVAIPHLLRSGAARRGESIKPQLAEHLGIPESRVAKYLNDHCVVRWLQMDEDASNFAHFLIAVLRPALNQ